MGFPHTCAHHDEANPSMRPCHVYACVSPRQQPHLVKLVRGRYRIAVRIVMILLSANGMNAVEIADLLGYDPATVRRWISRFNTEGIHALADRPRPGRPPVCGPWLDERIRRLLRSPKAWTTARIFAAAGRPAISLRTVYRRVRQHASWRRPHLVAKSEPDHEAIVADIRDTVAALPAGSVVLAEDETHLDLIARVRAS
jgi:transposase